MNEYTPTTDEIRRAWWMDTDNPFDNEGASDVSFDRWLAAHDAALLAAHPAPAFKTGWVNGENYIAYNAAQPATAIDREAIAEAILRSDLDYTPKPDHWATLTDGHRDAYRANADAVLALLASGVLGGQSS